MNLDRFTEISGRYAKLRIAVVGDFCLDRYLEIDPALAETSIETGLAVHNVANIRAQAGAAGTVVNNLAALGIGAILPVGFCGEDGEGFELRRALAALPGVRLDHFQATPLRRTFTYTKPLVLEPGRVPRELSRLDVKNWTPTPPDAVNNIIDSIAALRGRLDAVIVLDQVSIPETGVLTAAVRRVLPGAAPLVIADARLGLASYPPLIFKMNAAELARLEDLPDAPGIEEISSAAARVAERNGQPAFVTIAERGLLAAAPDGTTVHVPALPVRGPIDVVGAGDAVTANLAAALASGATLHETLELAAIASSIVIHQLGTTGAASVAQLREHLIPLASS